MAARSDLLRIAVAAVALVVTNVSAQHTHQDEDFKLPLNPVPGVADGIYFPNTDVSFDYSKIDSKLLKEVVDHYGLDGSVEESNRNDIRDWLLEKSRDHVEYKVVDGLAETPLGNISQQCYDDVTKFFVDFDALQTYALKMWSSWGDTTPWFKALYTGNAKSAGAYELCTGLTKEDDGLPFGVQFCFMQRTVTFLPMTEAVGSCWPVSCSAKDLEIAHKTFLGRRGEGIFYTDCFEGLPWSGGAIATWCVMSFFALIVIIGTLYHVIAHDRVIANLEKSKKDKFDANSGEDNRVYEQAEHDEDSKGGEAEYESVLSVKATDKSIGAGESDIRYPVDESKHFTKNGGNDTKVFTPAYGSTKLIIDEENRGTKDGYQNSAIVENVDKLLMSFSIFHNTEKIFNTTSSSSSTFGALNGIRVLSMWWVILGHSVQFPLGFRYENPAYLVTWLVKTAFLPVVNGTFSVDTFFVLSGFLVTYMTLKELKKRSGRINWGLFYFHRFWRITPLYMVVLAIWTTLMPYLGVGGGKADFTATSSYHCEKYWWTNLLYINNLYPFPGNISKQCMGWSWYLSNDMQFYIISPVIIYCLYRSRKYGINLLALICAVSFGSTAYICWYWGLPAFSSTSPYYNNRSETTPGIDPTDDFIYGKPYVRIQTYIVGMMLGYIVYELNGKPYKLKKSVNLLGWVVSATLACTVIYGLQAINNGPLAPQWLSITYNCLSRFTYAVAIAWVMFACVTGNGGYVNSFLSWNAWAPLARLSFAAYLIHPVIIFLVVTTKKSLLHVTYVEISYWFIANVAASYACAYILVLLVESPTVGMEKVLLGLMKKKEIKPSTRN